MFLGLSTACLCLSKSVPSSAFGCFVRYLVLNVKEVECLLFFGGGGEDCA